MLGVHVTIEGMEQLNHELQRACSLDGLEKGLKGAAILAEGEAKRRCPVETGRLQRSIFHRKLSRLTQELRASANYADYVEYGTFRMRAGTPEQPLVYTSASGKYPSYRPFMRSALYSNYERMIAVIQKEIDETLKNNATG